MTVETDEVGCARRIGPDLLAAAAVLAVAVGNISVVGLVADQFHPVLTLVCSVVLTSGVLLIWRLNSEPEHLDSFKKRLRTIDPVLAVSLAVAGVLRWKPANFLQGGQDQGLYVNMAATLRRWGELRFPDAARQSLSLAAQRVYDLTALSSYYTVDKAKSTSFIEFYPLHPALMAVTSATLGGTGKLILTIMSVMAVWCGWHLAIEIDGRPTCARIFAALLALNPALVFFAKFPVSETVALTYTMMGFLFLIRGAKTPNRMDRALNLTISVLAFNSLFYVRWQYLLYLPFVALMVVGSLVFRKYRRLSRMLSAHSAACVILFILSLIFYKKKMPELYGPVMQSIQDMLPSGHLLLAGSVSVVVVAIVGYWYRRVYHFELARRWFERRSGLCVVLALALSAGSVFHLYRGESMYPWGYATPADSDSWVIRFHVIYRLGQYISPFLLLIVILMGLFSRPRNSLTSVLYLFAAICWMGVLLRPFVPYLYYYGRYIIVDVTPAMLLIGSVALTTLISGRLRIVGVGLLVLTLAYSSWFSFVQIGNSEGEDVGFYFGIASQVQQNDILVVSSVSQQVIVPLRAYFGLTVLGIPEQGNGVPTVAEVLAQFSEEARRRGGDLYYLGGEANPVAESTSVGVFRFTDTFITNTDHFRDGGESNVSSLWRLFLPARWVSNYFNWELYKVDTR